jgi:molybdopterin synthase catalytic subunit
LPPSADTAIPVSAEIDELRRRAARLRTFAGTLRDDDGRRGVIKAAEAYERIAAEFEKMLDAAERL